MLFRPLHAAKRPFPFRQQVLFVHLLVSWARPTKPSSRKSAKRKRLRTLKKNQGAPGRLLRFLLVFAFLAPRGVYFDGGVYSVRYGSFFGSTNTLNMRILFFWPTRDHSYLARSTYEEHLCVVALTGSERGTQIHHLASYFLVRSSIYSSSTFR